LLTTYLPVVVSGKVWRDQTDKMASSVNVGKVEFYSV